MGKSKKEPSQREMFNGNQPAYSSIATQRFPIAQPLLLQADGEEEEKKFFTVVLSSRSFDITIKYANDYKEELK
ncbi:hypothetical protein PV327_004836 [Microctonus hyperodae]|uniref:Uncharacterized protein n=1 Tax=Microctonus hyperodae TaxID=165561 RepID=A0AA39FD94_MICHY|nr:hypothetical protein PV327_004836 [Microctonus hyperodae]